MWGFGFINVTFLTFLVIPFKTVLLGMIKGNKILRLKLKGGIVLHFLEGD